MPSLYWQDLDEDNWSDLSGDPNLVGIVSEADGGIVAYCHRDLAPTLISALGAVKADSAPTDN